MIISVFTMLMPLLCHVISAVNKALLRLDFAIGFDGDLVV
jgi:hypothetical protein